MTYHNQF